MRPFEGIAGEADWVAMREIVPAATAELKPADHSQPIVTLATVLPLAWPAMVNGDGSIMLAAQTETASGDASKDLGDALSRALKAPPGQTIPPRPLPPDAPRIHELVDTSVRPSVIVHSRFDFWLGDQPEEEVDELTRASLERANAAVVPTARLASVEAAYWMRFGDRTQLRWVLPDPEEPLIDALARLQVEGDLNVGAASRYLGSYRCLGLLVPVWDLAAEAEVDDVEDEALHFWQRLTDALADSRALSPEQRRARESLRARQLTMH